MFSPLPRLDLICMWIVWGVCREEEDEALGVGGEGLIDTDMRKREEFVELVAN